MESLSDLARKYLDVNGISDKFFQEYIGCSQSLCSQWFSGKRKLKPDQIKKVHEFLSGSHIVTVKSLMEDDCHSDN